MTDTNSMPTETGQLVFQFDKKNDVARVICALIASGISLTIWLKTPKSERDAVFWACVGFLAVTSVVSLVFVETKFDLNKRRLIREFRFVGKVPLWRRPCLLAIFREIRLRFHAGEDEGSGFCFLSLVYRSGRGLHVQSYSITNQQGFDEARAAAEQLSKVTGLPVKDCL